MSDAAAGREEPKWKQFEKLAYEIQKDFAGAATVTLNDSIMGEDSQTARQIDISIRERIGQYQILVVIDCKDYKEPIDVKTVEEFSGLVRDVRANKSAIISGKGFTEAAINVARNSGIDTFRLVDTESINWKTYVAIPVLLERTYLQKFNMEFSAFGRFVLPYATEELAKLELMSAEGKRLGSTKSILHGMWDRQEIPHEPGIHKVPIGEGLFIEYNGVRSQVNVSALVLAAREYYFGPLPIQGRGFQDAQKGGFLTRRITTSEIEPRLIERGEVPGWTKVDDPEKLSVRYVMKMAYSDMYTDDQNPPEIEDSSKQ